MGKDDLIYSKLIEMSEKQGEMHSDIKELKAKSIKNECKINDFNEIIDNRFKEHKTNYHKKSVLQCGMFSVKNLKTLGILAGTMLGTAIVTILTT